MRTHKVVPALAAAVLALAGVTGCGDSGASSGQSGDNAGATHASGGDSGGSDAGADQAHCVDDEGRNVCDAMKKDQVIVTAAASGKRAELYDQDGGSPVNTVRGEGRLVAAGDQLTVVCRQGTSGSGDGNFGVLLTKEFAAPSASIAYYATGKVNGDNWGKVVFIDFRGLSDPESVEKQLKDKLTAQFPDVSSYTSCNDNRVVTTAFGKQLVTGS